MKRRFFLAAVVGLVLPQLLGCNLYSSFANPNNDEEYLQEAQKCLREGNYTCAIDNYSRIVSTDLKNEKALPGSVDPRWLGIAELGEHHRKQHGKRYVGRLARELMPWTEEKQTAMEAAVEECNKLSTISDSQKQALLRTVAYLSECAIKIAKSDLYVATSENTSSCNATADETGTGS